MCDEQRVIKPRHSRRRQLAILIFIPKSSYHRSSLVIPHMHNTIWGSRLKPSSKPSAAVSVAFCKRRRSLDDQDVRSGRDDPFRVRQFLFF